MTDNHWKGHPVDLARSVRGVRAFRDAWQGVVHGDVTPWPPPELVQKIYQSRQARAYVDEQHALATAAHGYYSDLQSVHSEDAVTWSLFGPLSYAAPEIRARFASELLGAIGIEEAIGTNAHIWLWRRIPHPDTLVSGGPEIDFGIHTGRTLVLGEAKWRSGIGKSQGVDGSKDQIDLRVQFCRERGATLYPGVERFVLLLVGQTSGAHQERCLSLTNGRIQVVEATWQELGALASNPWRDEFLSHLAWRESYSTAS